MTRANGCIDEDLGPRHLIIADGWSDCVAVLEERTAHRTTRSKHAVRTSDGHDLNFPTDRVCDPTNVGWVGGDHGITSPEGSLDDGHHHDSRPGERGIRQRTLRRRPAGPGNDLILVAVVAPGATGATRTRGVGGGGVEPPDRPGLGGRDKPSNERPPNSYASAPAPTCSAHPISVNTLRQSPPPSRHATRNRFAGRPMCWPANLPPIEVFDRYFASDRVRCASPIAT